MSMERTEVLDMMGALKLYGMKGAYDETLATAIKRKHEPQRLVGDLLKAEISEKQARSIRYQMTIAKLPLAKDVDDFAFKGTPINESLVRDLAGGNFVVQQRNLVLVGGTGMYRQRCRIRGRGEDGWSIATVTRRSDRGSGPAPMRRCRTVAILPLAAGR
jgi:IstB-like ATP binding protein